MNEIDLTRPEPPSGDSPLRRLIVERMFEQGLTLEDVAQRGGLSFATVAALRTGGRGKRPRRATLERLACGLDLSLEQVLAAAAPALPAADEDLLLECFRRLDPIDKRLVVAHVTALAEQARSPAGSSTS